MKSAFFSFDDDVTLAAAKADPVGFVACLPDLVVLDEVQRALQLFPAIKSAVDRRRTPGRFLLTGSANVLLLPTLADSLEGRLGLLRLNPLAQCELANCESRFLELLFTNGFKIPSFERLGQNLAERVAAGGYPAALARTTPRLLTLAAGQSARLINISDLASPFQLSRPTIRDYVTLLEQVLLIDDIPPWHSNRMNRLVKTPKLHVGDTGLACALLGLDAAGLWRDRGLLGQYLETFVYQELRRQACWQDSEIRFSHYRDKDFAGPRKLKNAAGSKFTAGVVLYDGETSASFGEGLHAVPTRTLWEAAST